MWVTTQLQLYLHPCLIFIKNLAQTLHYSVYLDYERESEMKILLVDDAEAVRNLISNILIHWDMRLK